MDLSRGAMADPFAMAMITIAVFVVIVFLLILVLWFSGMTGGSSSTPTIPSGAITPSTPIALTTTITVGGTTRSLSIIKCSNTFTCGNHTGGSATSADGIQLVPTTGSSSYFSYGDTVNMMFTSGGYLSICLNTGGSLCGNLIAATVTPTTNWQIISQTKAVGTPVLSGDTVGLMSTANNLWLMNCGTGSSSNCGSYIGAQSSPTTGWQWLLTT